MAECIFLCEFKSIRKQVYFFFIIRIAPIFYSYGGSSVAVVAPIDARATRATNAPVKTVSDYKEAHSNVQSIEWSFVPNETKW